MDSMSFAVIHGSWQALKCSFGAICLYFPRFLCGIMDNVVFHKEF